MKIAHAILGLVQVCLCVIASAGERWSSDDDVRVAFGSEPFQFAESFVEHELQVDAYSSRAVFFFAVRGDRTVPHGYRVAQSAGAPDRTQWEVVLHEPIPLPRNTPGRCLALLSDSNSPRTLPTARKTLSRMLAARGQWQVATLRLADANGGDHEKSHAAWVQIATALENAQSQYPEHLGIAVDLLAAYAQLLTFERTTDRGHAICRLMAARFNDLNLPVSLDLESSDSLTRSEVLWHFATERYPRVAELLPALKSRPDSRSLTAALEAIHQDRFTKRPTLEVTVGDAKYSIDSFATDRETPDPRVQHHLRYFFPRPTGARAGQTWFTLTTQQLTDAPRYYLYGWEGNRAKVLRLYGRAVPTDAEVTEVVRQFVATALKTPPTENRGVP